VYDTAEGMPRILTDGAAYYLYGPDGVPFEQVTTGGTVTYLHADQLGSIRMITSSTGTSVGTATYTTYGTGTATGTTSAFGYAGQYTDTESGLQWLRARYYDPATGQFLTVDPLTAATGARYAYAGGNPITRADPLGLWGWNPLDWTASDWGTVGLVAGGIALAATGVGLIADAGLIGLGAMATATVEVVGMSAGAVAIATDAVPCVSSFLDSTQKPNVAACVGATFGLVSLGTGIVPGILGKLSSITSGTTAGLEDWKSHADAGSRIRSAGVGCW
jgi:RHS repeat-associated protein